MHNAKNLKKLQFLEEKNSFWSIFLLVFLMIFQSYYEDAYEM